MGCLNLRKKQKKQLVLLETGSGASTLAMFLHCALFGGTMYSWDTNASKGSFLRSVISESIGRILSVDVNKIWTFIPFNSVDPNIGIRVLKELNKKHGTEIKTLPAFNSIGSDAEPTTLPATNSSSASTGNIL